MELFGEGQYNLLSLKEIRVTSSFRGLDQSLRKCQNTEAYGDCITRKHLENMRTECGCLPLSIRLSEKVTCISEFKGRSSGPETKTSPVNPLTHPPHT